MIKEILTVKDQLTDKFKYLISGPKEDNEGLDTILRFSRKTKEQYVTTEIDGKATNWRAYYQDGRWVEDIGKTPATKPETKKTTTKKTTVKKAAAKKAPAKKKVAAKGTTKKSILESAYNAS